MIPVGDSNRRYRTPWVTYAIIAVNAALFLYMLALPSEPPATRREEARQFVEQTESICYGFPTFPTDADRFVCKWALQPREFFDTLSGDNPVSGDNRVAALLAIVTSIFLHGGWLHIFGNMLFLWVFGDNIEDRLGHAVYLVFYLLAGVVASFIQAVMEPNSVVPVLGASGAVAGVLGAYLMWYPTATIRVVIPFFILIFIPLPIPAWVMIGVWFAQNLLAGWATITDAAQNATGGGVAWFAHLGGFAFGLLIAWLAGPDRRRRDPWA